MSSFIYILAFLSALVAGYYCWSIIQMERQVGGWWNLATGNRSPQANVNAQTGGSSAGGSTDRMNVEQRIKGLAEALGMPSKDLAKAIAAAVRDHVPPKSLSSVASKETGSVVDELTQQHTDGEEGGGIVNILDSIAGWDEPPEGI